MVCEVPRWVGMSYIRSVRTRCRVDFSSYFNTTCGLTVNLYSCPVRIRLEEFLVPIVIGEVNESVIFLGVDGGLYGDGRGQHMSAIN